LNVAVFAQLSDIFGVPIRTIWDTLFPQRGTRPRPWRE
jgi:hypothetical protein